VRAAGRAAQRLQEAANTKGARATTVHRLLGYQSRGALGAERAGSGLLHGVFTHCADTPLEADAVLARPARSLPRQLQVQRPGFCLMDALSA